MAFVKAVKAETEKTASSWQSVTIEDISWEPRKAALIGPDDDGVVGELLIRVPVTRGALKSRSEKGNAGFGFRLPGAGTVEGFGNLGTLDGRLMPPKGGTISPMGASGMADLRALETRTTRKGGKGK